jgi:glycosyltransferase involved in cell wall biosynthesis
MKIAMIGQKGIPASYGGVERHTEELAVRLAEKEHRVFVYARNYYVPKKISKFKKVKIIKIPTIQSKNLDAICHTFLSSLDVLKRDIDVVHYQGIGPSSLLLIPKILKRKAKIIVTFHTRDYLNPKWGWFAKFYLKLSEKIMICFADQIIVVSKNLKDYCQTKYQKKVYYIPNGISLPVENSSKEITDNFCLEKDNYILTVSRLVEQKGIQFLIEAYNSICRKKLLEKIPSLVIVGGAVYTDSYFKKLKKTANNNPKIIFLDFQQGEELQGLFSNCLFFVNPSVLEGLSIALLEAMSYGKCVLVSDIPENLEAVNHRAEKYGVAFKNKNTADLAKKIEFLLSNPELIKEKGKQAQDYVLRKYNWNEITSKTIEVYKN